MEDLPSLFAYKGPAVLVIDGSEFQIMTSGCQPFTKVG